MKCETSILIRAPLERVFQTTADVPNWPKLLPHYRWVRVLRAGEDGLVVKMAARRGWLPIRWTARFQADAGARQLRFQHLTALTRGMRVSWTYTPGADGVRVSITHELDRWYAGLLARYFIHPVARRTLAAFKAHLERS